MELQEALRNSKEPQGAPRNSMKLQETAKILDPQLWPWYCGSSSAWWVVCHQPTFWWWWWDEENEVIKLQRAKNALALWGTQFTNSMIKTLKHSSSHPAQHIFCPTHLCMYLVIVQWQTEPSPLFLFRNEAIFKMRHFQKPYFSMFRTLQIRLN